MPQQHDRVDRRAAEPLLDPQRGERAVGGDVVGLGVADPRELPAALRRAIDSGGPAVVHVDVDPVKHMWAPGLVQFKDMHQEPKGR